MNEGEAVKINFLDGVQMLKEEGFEQDPLKDLTTINEAELGKIVKKKFNTDFYILYNYPRSA